LLACEECAEFPHPLVPAKAGTQFLRKMFWVLQAREVSYDFFTNSLASNGSVSNSVKAWVPASAGTSGQAGYFFSATIAV
jgi:hypothetical protein